LIGWLLAGWQLLKVGVFQNIGDDGRRSLTWRLQLWFSFPIDRSIKLNGKPRTGFFNTIGRKIRNQRKKVWQLQELNLNCQI
jgi:hypothetical protein